MPYDMINIGAPSADLMIEEISRLENELFQAEKKIRDITILLGHARNLLSFKVTDCQDSASLSDDVDQLLAVSEAIGSSPHVKKFD